MEEILYHPIDQNERNAITLGSLSDFSRFLGHPGFRASTVFWFRWTPQPVIVTIRDHGYDTGVLLYSYYTTITGWGVLLTLNRHYRMGGPPKVWQCS